jgi:hypothetical protein
MAARPERVEIGFAGGQVVAVRVAAEQLQQLHKALGSTEKHSSEAARWYELETEDGPISIDLRQIVFVRVGAGERRVGFSSL